VLLTPLTGGSVAAAGMEAGAVAVADKVDDPTRVRLGRRGSSTASRLASPAARGSTRGGSAEIGADVRACSDIHSASAAVEATVLTGGSMVDGGAGVGVATRPRLDRRGALSSAASMTGAALCMEKSPLRECGTAVGAGPDPGACGGGIGAAAGNGAATGVRPCAVDARRGVAASVRTRRPTSSAAEGGSGGAVTAGATTRVRAR